jgi:hypothetical protein
MINAYLMDTVKIIRYSRDVHGERSQSSTEMVKARVELDDKVVKDVRGMEVISAGRVLIPTRPLTHEDTITFPPTGAAAREYVILQINRPRDFGWGYLEVRIV